MKKGILMALVVVSGLLLLLVGCNGGDKEAANPPVEESAQVSETHDCDGGCGMTNMPALKTTEIDGKYYCAGCAAKLKAKADEEKSGHEGHGHG